MPQRRNFPPTSRRRLDTELRGGYTTKGNLTYRERLWRAAEATGHPYPFKVAISEDEMDRQVMETAKMFGWDFSYHVWDSRQTAAGWPDRILLHYEWRRALFVELKDLLRPVTPKQSVVLTLLARAGLEVGVWRPTDMDEVEAVLRNDARLAPPLRSAWRG